MPRPTVPEFLPTVANLKYWKIPGVEFKCFGPMYTPKHTRFHWQAMSSKQSIGLKHQISMDRYHARLAESPKTLWWNANSNAVVAKKVVRSWMSRRLRDAMRAALKTHGLDHLGRAVGPEARPISGTLQLHALGHLATAKFVDVQKEAELLVEHVKRQNKR